MRRSFFIYALLADTRDPLLCTVSLPFIFYCAFFFLCLLAFFVFFDSLALFCFPLVSMGFAHFFTGMCFGICLFLVGFFVCFCVLVCVHSVFVLFFRFSFGVFTCYISRVCVYFFFLCVCLFLRLAFRAASLDALVFAFLIWHLSFLAWFFVFYVQFCFASGLYFCCISTRFWFSF